jgi:hypothetical protein
MASVTSATLMARQRQPTSFAPISETLTTGNHSHFLVEPWQINLLQSQLPFAVVD